MNAERLRKTLFLTSIAAMCAMGCELIVDFDRTKIPIDDAGTVDATPSETSTDAPADTNPTETGTDAAADATDAADDVADAADSG